MSRLELVMSSAKKLIDALLSSEKNIYIGLVFFRGNNYRARGLVKDKDLLYADIDKATELVKNKKWEIAYTDIGEALDKVGKSYANNELMVFQQSIILKKFI